MRLSVLPLFLTFLVLSACGPGKKLQVANSQNLALTTQVNNLNKQVAENNATINQLKQANSALSKDAEDCKKLKEAAQQRIANLNKALASQGTSMEELKGKAARALKGFDNAGCEVEYTNGLIKVTIPEKMLFNANSTQISSEGKQVISVVADVLIDFKKMKAIVVGNSDSIAVSGTGSKFNDNWSLSTERAIAVVRVLRDKFDIDPARLTAAGKSKYNPIADNNTEEGRSKNRRIEVFLDPDYKKIMELTENK